MADTQSVELQIAQLTSTRGYLADQINLYANITKDAQDRIEELDKAIADLQSKQEPQT